MNSLRRLRLIAVAVLCTLAALPALAQSSAYQPGSPLLMWKISSESNSAYVLGSIHLGDKSLYPMPATIQDAFQSADLLIVEVDIRNVDVKQMQMAMLQSGTYPPGDDLFKHISPETRTRLTSYLGSFGMPAEGFSRMRAWMLGATIEMLPMLKAGLNPGEGIDLYFLNKAGEKRVEQLEDAEWQIKLLSQMPESISDAWLSHALDESADWEDHWEKLATSWRQGDAAALDQLLSGDGRKEGPEEQAFDRKLREERNPPMADRLEKCLHSTDSCFMVVGAAHVVGTEGIVKLMQKRGYRVEQTKVETSAPDVAVRR